MAVDVEILILPDGSQMCRVFPRGTGRLTVIERDGVRYASTLPDVTEALAKLTRVEGKASRNPSK